MLSVVRSKSGSGSGITEYTYQLITHIKPLLSKSDSIEEIYAIDESKYNNLSGLIYTNTIFKKKLALAAKKNFDIIHITDHEIGFAAKIIKRSNKNAKIITTVHDLLRFEKKLHEGIAQKAYNRFVRNNVKEAIRYSDVILCNSNQTYETILNRFPQTKNVKLVPHGIDDSFFKTRKLSKLNSKRKFIVGYLGSFAYHKNVIFLLKTANLLKNNPNIEFQIYGTGSELSNLTKFKNQHQLDNVKFMGVALQESKARIFDSFDIFIFPSLYEGLGYPILEAQARGSVVIITKKSHISPEVRKHCLEVGGASECARLLIKYETNKIGKSQSKKIMMYAKTFTWQKCARRTLNLYRSLI